MSEFNKIETINVRLSNVRLPKKNTHKNLMPLLILSTSDGNLLLKGKEVCMSDAEFLNLIPVNGHFH